MSDSFMFKEPDEPPKYGWPITSGTKIWKDSEMTIEMPLESISKEAFEAIFGLVPIIYCKDCLYLCKYDRRYNCYCKKLKFWPNENDYCSKGILKGEANDV